MSMTRKHFEDMAESLRLWRAYEEGQKLTRKGYTELVRAMGDVCIRANISFDRNKFEEACGL